uniref:Uncharacterized protein n=1 Tax=Nymphaea colorata TaxID=210225 RepID=A0A5K0YJY9_9MAGN|nr:unnamed protein product [Nymphaea colorata]
MHQADVRLE